MTTPRNTPDLLMTRLTCGLAALGLAALVLPACAGGTTDPETLRSADVELAAEAPAERTASSPGPAVTAAAAAEEPAPAVRAWRPWVEAEVERLRQEQPEYFNAVMDLPTRTTRAQMQRLTGPLVRNPDAAPILLHRLLTRNEPASVRAAIVEALPRTQGDFSAAVAELMALETDPQVRELLCSALFRAQAPYALEGLALGLADVAPRVRAEAVRSLGRRSDGAELAAGIIEALRDPDPVVQQEAARALGTLQVEAAVPALQVQLGASTPEVRLHALRSLSRIAPAHTRALPELATLRSDADPKVARLAESLASGQ